MIALLLLSPLLAGLLILGLRRWPAALGLAGGLGSLAGAAGLLYRVGVGQGAAGRLVLPGLPGMPFGLAATPFTAVLALVVAVVAWPPLQWALTRPALLALGRVSFMVYLCHIIVLCSLASGLVLWLTPGWGYDAATAVALAATLVTVLGVAAVMTRWVDVPATALSRWMERQALAWDAAGRATRRRSA